MPPQISWRQKGDVKPVPHWGPTNISRHSTHGKAIWSPEFVHPCDNTILVLTFQTNVWTNTRAYCYSYITITVCSSVVIYPKIEYEILVLTFIGPCIVLYFYSKTNQMHNISKLFYFVVALYMFRTVFPSIIRSLILYIQHQVYVKQIQLTAC